MNCKSTYLIFLIVCFFTLNIAQAAVVTFNGAGDGTSWEDPANWDSGSVPDAVDDVIITNADAVTISTTVEANSLRINMTAQLTVNPSGVLALTRITNNGAMLRLNDYGKLVNNGSVNIVQGGGGDAIDGNNNSVVINNGSISVIDAGSDVINLSNNAQFINYSSGTITGGQSGDAIDINNSADFFNHGSIYLDDFSDEGIEMSGNTTFTNTGYLNINDVNNDHICLDDNGTVFNNFGTIDLNDAGSSAIEVDDGIFTNEAGGMISVSDIRSSGLNVESGGEFDNFGEINVQMNANSSSDDGVDIECNAIFRNYNTLNISISGNAGANTLFLDCSSSTFRNEECAVVNMLTNHRIELDGGADLINEGVMATVYSGTHDNQGNFTNNGVINAPNGFNIAPNALLGSGTVDPAGIVPATAGPIITCPADVTIEVEDDRSPASNGSATATDNCDASPAISFEDNENLDCTGTITRTFTATDSQLNTASCDQTLTIVDNVPPVAVCQDITVELDGSGNVSITPVQVDGGSSDNCSFTLSLDVNSFTCADIGPNIVNLTATDPSNNSHACPATVTVEDTTDPVITCPADITIECDDSQDPLNTGEATGTDNCDTDVTIHAPSDLTTAVICTGSYTIVRTWTAEDNHGNTDDCDQLIRVEDTTPPAMVCNPLTITPNTDGTYTLSQAEIDGLGAGSTDNCSSVTFTAVPSFFNCADEGVNNVTVTGTDECGNSANCTAIITVNPYLTIISCTPTDETCSGAGDGKITIVATSLGGQIGYSIDDGANYQFNGTFVNLTPGIYNIRVKVFGIAEVCEKTDTKTVGAGPAPMICYKDVDGDGYTDGQTVTACSCPTGYVPAATAGDCNDSNSDIYPGAPELCDGLDNDCDGVVPANEQDKDGDGYAECDGDCNDNNAAINPGAAEICDGEDNDCDGDVDEGVSSGQTYVGDVTFVSQAQVDAWLSCYSVIQGNLTITGYDIIDLSNLIGIEEVTGSVSIYYNGSLTTLDGLDNLSTVGGSFSMFYNFALSNCCAIDNLLTNGGITGSISIFFNAYSSHCNSAAEIMAACPLSPLINDPNNGSFISKESINQVGERKLTLMPNPASNRVDILFSRKGLDAKMQIVDLLGRVVFEQEIEEGVGRLSVDLSSIETGIYIVAVIEGGEMRTKQLMIQR